MNTGEHITKGGGVRDREDRRNSALAELRMRLENGRAGLKLSKTDLAARAFLGRTTVQEAFRADGPVPSLETVAALAKALGLPVGELLELQREAATDTGAKTRPGPGRPIGEWDPHALEVHPAGPDTPARTVGTRAGRALPRYVPRAHDVALAEAVRDVAAGRSRIVVLVGSSSTGKTRACWEAVQPLASQGWHLWHPFDPSRAEAALDALHRVQPHTVVWLNEAQFYLGDRTAGERIAAAVHTLLTDPERGPVLVLGTLWPTYAAQYTALARFGMEDPHSRVRELLAGSTLTVPDAFDRESLATATAFAQAGDQLLAQALTRAGKDGRLAQDLAGAPELLNRFEHPRSAAARALLEAAMDACRLGVSPYLQQEFLTEAAVDYLADIDYDDLSDDWAEQAYAELAEPVHGKQAPLRRITPRPQRRPPAPVATANASLSQPTGPLFRLADFLEQHGRAFRKRHCPPASFWHAAHACLTNPDDLDNLARHAENRHRLQWAHHLRQRAADRGSPHALVVLAQARERAGDRAGADSLAREAAGRGDARALTVLARIRDRAGDRKSAEALYREAADLGDARALTVLARMRETDGDRVGAEALYRQVAGHGKSAALADLAQTREKAGDPVGAEAMAREAADHGDTGVLVDLARMRQRAGDPVGAGALYREAADLGDVGALIDLATLREGAGNWVEAEAVAREAAHHGNTRALVNLARRRDEAGDQMGAETLYRQAAGHGSSRAWVDLVWLRERAGDCEGAEALAWEAANVGTTRALVDLAQAREEAGDRNRAEALYRKAADHGDATALTDLARLREEAGDRAGAELIAREAARHGNTRALTDLARKRNRTGDQAGAELLAREAAHHGNTRALTDLAQLREEAGDRRGTESLYREAADHGDITALTVLTRLREEAGDRMGAEALAREAADHGSTLALTVLARLREEAGDRAGAEVLAREAADYGSTRALIDLARLREQVGDRIGAEALAREAADHGTDPFFRSEFQVLRELWPSGMDPDGSATPAWEVTDPGEGPPN